jgi:glyoxylase-like metal-dependent hydrolase (beta-lactamase superfamily II)
MSSPAPYLHTIVVPTPFPVGPVNVYLAEGDPLTLVDTGPRFDPAREALHRGLADRDCGPGDLDRIILTHAHSDHCGLAAELARASGAEVVTHAANIAELADTAGQRADRLAFYAQVMREAGVPLRVMMRINRTRRGYGQFAQSVAPDRALGDGEEIVMGGEAWRVLHTPGHTGGLICLYQPQRRLLLSSDHLLRDVSSNPIVEPPVAEGESRPRRLVDYVAQLRRVAELPVERALPGHGEPIREVEAIVARRLAFHEERAERILDILGRRERTVYQISKVLFPDLDPINRFLAVSEVIGHLDWLEERGQVTHRMKGRKRLWRVRGKRSETEP